MKNRSSISLLFLLLILGFNLNSCKIYTFSGYSIEPDVETAFIAQFPNQAAIVAPSLSQTLSESLRDKMVNEINLRLINSKEAHIVLGGVISNYKVDPVAFTADDQAAQNRLTITLKINYTNNKHPEKSWESSFSRFADFDVSKNFSDVEEDLIQEITEQLVTDVFNKAFVNW